MFLVYTIIFSHTNKLSDHVVFVDQRNVTTIENLVLLIRFDKKLHHEFLRQLKRLQYCSFFYYKSSDSSLCAFFTILLSFSSVISTFRGKA